MSDETMKKAETDAKAPDSMSELDRTRLQLAIERTQRTKAEAALAVDAHNRAKSTQAMLESEMSSRYKIGKDDQVDVGTGKIVRPGEGKPALKAVEPAAQ